ncbi:MAG: aroK [Acidimicrobiaceae bacterium]|nr:MAG: aroK [Acidimicrobiaceae bacterium]
MIPPDQHLVLVGLMGTGKSSVARILAERMGRNLCDTDAEIERQTSRTVREILLQEGEPAFRIIETGVLVAALAALEPAVIAAAGGVVLSEQNRAALADSKAKVVWLRAEPSTLVERVRCGMHRPSIEHDPEAGLRAMHEVRDPLYREVADMIITVDGRSVHEVAEAILR